MIGKWYGIGHHTYVTMQVEDNPIWDEAEQAWRTCWDDLEARGEFVRESFSSPTVADAFVERKLATKRFRGLRPVHSKGNRDWHYKDGD